MTKRETPAVRRPSSLCNARRRHNALQSVSPRSVDRLSCFNVNAICTMRPRRILDIYTTLALRVASAKPTRAISWLQLAWQDGAHAAERPDIPSCTHTHMCKSTGCMGKSPSLPDRTRCACLAFLAQRYNLQAVEASHSALAIAMA